MGIICGEERLIGGCNIGQSDGYKRQIGEKDKRIKEIEEILVIKNKKIDELESKIKEIVAINSFIPSYEDKNPLKFYDIIVDINSIKEIKKGWQVLMNDRGNSYFNENNKNSIKIGVIGNGNKGKSFLLSKISGMEFPTGFSVQTKGLSIKFPVLDKYKNRNIILLDSAGQETPVLDDEKNNDDNVENNGTSNATVINTALHDENKIKKQEQLTEKSRDKLLTEFFLQSYIVKYTDLLIVVVGILTFSEQKLINKIKKTYSNLKKTNSLVVIHNLQLYVTKKQVQNYIETVLKNSGTFDLEEQTIISMDREKEKWTYFYEPKSTPTTIHLIFARDKSEAGDFYNKKTIEYLYDKMNNVPEKEPLNLYENIKNFFESISGEILENPIQSDYIVVENNTIKLANLPKDYALKLKKCSIDELGLNKFRLNGYDPSYSYYIDDKNLHIICEIPGKIDKESFSSHAECKNGKCYIKISGNKIDDIKDVKNNCKKIFSKREFGNFNLDIAIDNVNVDICGGKLNYNNNGLIEIIYPIKPLSITIKLK